jgi:hypothetical protein
MYLSTKKYRSNSYCVRLYSFMFGGGFGVWSDRLVVKLGISDMLCYHGYADPRSLNPFPTGTGTGSATSPSLKTANARR